MAKKTREEIEREQMLKQYRMQIQDEELLARMNKATHDKMHYFIEGTKLIPEYAKLIKEQQDLREAQITKADATIASALSATASESDPVPISDLDLESGSLEITGISAD